MKSPIPIRVLIVDDSEDDTRLIVRELERGNYELEFEQVVNAEAMSSALRREKWDIVLSDYSMPNFSGPAALILLQKSGLDIPFILISGKIGEEEVASIIKAGAGDFISKDRLQRLPVAVERELREMEVRRQRRQMQKALEESEEKYRNLIERANDGICIIQDRLVKFANARLAEMWGGAIEDLINTPFANYVHPDDLPRIVERYNRRLAGEQVPSVYEAVLKSKDGSKLYTELNIGIINYLGKPAEFVIIRDVSERKQAEEALRETKNRYSHLVENIPVALSMVQDGKIIFTNKHTEMITGYSLDELQSMDGFSLIHPEDRERVRNYLFERLKGGDVSDSYLFRIRNRNGEIRWLERRVIKSALEGKLEIITVDNDVTERERMDERLRDSEIRYRRLFETAQDAILILNGDTGQIIDANPFIKDLLGYSLEELQGKSLWEIGELKDTLASKISYQQLHESGYKRWNGLPLVTRDGRQISVEVVANAYYIDHTKVIQCNIRDMTEADMATTALKEVNQDLKVAQRLTRIGNWKWTLATNMVTWSEELCHINGWDTNLPVPPFAEMDRFYTPESWGRLSKLVTKALNTGESYELELTQIRTDGTEIITFSRGEADYDAGGKIVGLHGTVQDITEHKQVEETLRFQSQILQNMAEGVQVTRVMDQVIVYTNPTFEKMFGYGQGELLGKHVSVLNAPTEKTSRETAQEIIRSIEDTGTWNGVVHSIKRDGNTFWCRASVLTFEHPRYGAVWIAVHQDITERKRAEEELVRLRKAVETSGEVIFLTDTNGIFTFVNPEFTRTYGYTSEEVIGNVTPRILKSGFVNKNDYESLWQTLINKQTVKGEFINKTKAGRMINIEGSASAVLDDSGNIIGFLAVQRDITERKKTEMALHRSEENFRRSLDDSPLGIRIVNDDGETAYANRAILDIYGYDSIEELKATPTQERYTPESYTEHQVRSEMRQRGGYVPDRYGISIIRKDGNTRHLEVLRKEVLWNGKLQFQVLYNDITERKKTEVALSRSEENFRRSIANSPMGIRISDDAAYTLYANKALLTLYGCDSVEQFNNVPFKKRFTPESYAETMVMREKRERGEYVPDHYEIGMVRPDGEIRQVQIYRTPVLWDGEMRYQVLYNDITELKRTEKLLRESEEKFRSLAEQSPNMVFINEAGRVVFVNHQCEEIMGYTKEEFSAPDFDFLTLIAPEYKALVQASFSKHMGAEEVSPLDYSIVTKDGRRIDVILATKLLNYGGGKAFVGIMTDITERKQAETRLKEAQVLGRIGSWEFNVETQKITWSDETYVLFERDPQLGPPCPEEEARYYSAEQAKVLRDYAASAIETGQHFSDDIKVLLPSGKEANYYARMQPIKDAQGRVVKLDGIIQDITERKRAEEEITRFKIISDIAPYGLTMLDKERRITYTNRTCAQLHGYAREELIGQHCTILVPENQLEAINAIFERSEKTGGFVNVEIVHKRKDGATFPAMMTGVTVKDERGEPLYTSVVFVDVTEQKKIQEQLMAQDRLASIGQLVSGVAHEINNPLTGIIGFSELLLQRELPDDVKAELKIVNDEAMRTASIVKNLLTFARKQPEGKTPADINEIIGRVLALRKHEQTVSNINVDARLASGLPQVMGNASQLQQVFFNIIINAEFFMLKAHNRGNLTITTESTGNTVRCSFTDDGPGITGEHLKGLFTPFFTTKEIGKGTGLGLSICHGIVNEHGGRIYAESELGKGATFTVELPIIEERTIVSQIN